MHVGILGVSLQNYAVILRKVRHSPSLGSIFADRPSPIMGGGLTARKAFVTAVSSHLSGLRERKQKSSMSSCCTIGTLTRLLFVAKLVFEPGS